MASSFFCKQILSMADYKAGRSFQNLIFTGGKKLIDKTIFNQIEIEESLVQNAVLIFLS